MKYKELIETTLVELRMALERGRSAVQNSSADESEKGKLLHYIQSFDDRFTRLEKYLTDVYKLFIQKEELIKVYDEKLHEAYEEIARLKMDNKDLEYSLMTDDLVEKGNIKEEEG